MNEVTMGVTRSRTRITPEGEFQEYYEIEFHIDDARYTLEMAPAKFTAKAAEEAVRKKAAELVAIRGKKIELP